LASARAARRLSAIQERGRELPCGDDWIAVADIATPTGSGDSGLSLRVIVKTGTPAWVAQRGQLSALIPRIPPYSVWHWLHWNMGSGYPFGVVIEHLEAIRPFFILSA
jgi:hypothetical protein